MDRARRRADRRKGLRRARGWHCLRPRPRVVSGAGPARAVLPGALWSVRVPPRSGRTGSIARDCRRTSAGGPGAGRGGAAGHGASHRRHRSLPSWRAGVAREHLERAMALYDAKRDRSLAFHITSSTRSPRVPAACRGPCSPSATPSRPKSKPTQCCTGHVNSPTRPSSA